MSRPVISEFMSAVPHSIGVDRPLSAAHDLMRQFRIRHLPVLQRGELVGMVTERDLHLVETLKDVNPQEVTVEEAMSQGVYVVPPTEPLEEVVLEMWKRKLGSAVVMNGPEVVGVFTTVDALGALGTLLARARQKTPAKAPALAKKSKKVNKPTRSPARRARAH